MFPARQQNMARATYCVLPFGCVYFSYATKAHAHACCLGRIRGARAVIKSLPKTTLPSVLVRGVGRQRGALVGWYQLAQCRWPRDVGRRGAGSCLGSDVCVLWLGMSMCLFFCVSELCHRKHTAPTRGRARAGSTHGLERGKRTEPTARRKTGRVGVGARREAGRCLVFFCECYFLCMHAHVTYTYAQQSPLPLKCICICAELVLRRYSLQGFVSRGSNLRVH
jgi:hypothetical protein